MFHSIRQQLREARTCAFRSYEQKYGELHHRDPRTDEVTLVVLTPEHAAWVAEVLVASGDQT
jgi:ferritin-like protein